MTDRAMRGDDVFHMTLASPTGAASPTDAPITLDEIAAYVLSKMAPVSGPSIDEIVAQVMAKMPAPSTAPPAVVALVEAALAAENAAHPAEPVAPATPAA
jgi:hypothetical protein